MSVSVERLRVGLVAGAGLLVLIVAAFLGYAHYRAHRLLTGLPARLGIDVRQETNGYTYSQTVGSKTIYTVHAAKSVQHRDGKYTLKDVGIVVYGKKQDRADRIYGSEFELDQAAGVIRAMGEVFIDLQAPEARDANEKMDFAAGNDLRGSGEAAAGKGAAANGAAAAKLIHIRTSGLVYLQKLGVAATDKEIEFTSGGVVGHAVGADYNSDTGIVILHSSVKVTGVEHDRPVVLTASEAELDRQNQTAALRDAKYMAVGERAGGKGVGETAEARHVVVYLRKDGSAERVQADGEVTLTDGLGGRVTAPRGEMRLGEENHPQSAVLVGGVRYAEDGQLRQAQGEAAEGRAVFDRAGRVEHVAMKGAVHLKERVRVSEATGDPWGERELGGDTVELAMATDGGRTELRDAKATGAARLNVENPASKGVGAGAAASKRSGGATSSALSGDVLTAHFVTMNGASRLSEMQGAGHTLLRRVGANGVVNTSSGDSLVARFRPVSGGDPHRRQGSDEIASAVEQGHVVMTQTPVRKPGDSTAPQQERATAERAVYDGGLEQMTLTGDVQVNDGTSVLWADCVVTEQGAGNGMGDATADGSVKASYREAGSSDEPVHVLAARAELKRDAQKAIFYGDAGRPARLWQAGSQVEAPVLEFEQKQGRLLAHGEGQGGGMAVHTVLVSTGNGNGNGKKGAGGVAAGGVRPGKEAGMAAGNSAKTEVVRVASGALNYSDEARKAEFTGGVQVESADGNMRAQQAVVYLQAAPAGTRVVQGIASRKEGAGETGVGESKPAQSGGQSGGLMGGGVDRIVATDGIAIEQPGRRATGEQVVYTAKDGMFVLTGTVAAPPRVVDQRQGTVTGASLRFHSGDDDIVVSNGGEKGQRVRTETRVKSRK